MSEHVAQADELDAGLHRKADGPLGEARLREVEELGPPLREQRVVGCTRIELSESIAPHRGACPFALADQQPTPGILRRYVQIPVPLPLRADSPDDAAVAGGPQETARTQLALTRQ